MNKVEPKTLSGFMELLPNEQVLFNEMQDKIRASYETFGFLPIDTPVIESSEVLLAKAGGETEKQLYSFTKGDSNLTLRFDLTVPLAKYVSEYGSNITYPFRRYQIGKVYRGERAQRGRFREFYQCDIDVIGDGELSLINDAQLPAVIYNTFKELGFDNFTIHINNRKILNGLFNSLELNDKSVDVLRIIDKIDKIGVLEVKNELSNLEINDNDIDKIINFITIDGTNESKLMKLKNNYCDNELFNLGVSELESVINDLEDRCVPVENYEIDLTIARGLDYYTGTVYETTLVDYPSIGSVCSGGRYENLAEYYTDKNLPGVGVSIGLTRLFYQLMEAKIIEIDNISSSDILILPMCDKYEYIYEIDSILKEKYSTNICFLDKGFKQKMKFANKMNNKYVIIIGEDEVNSDTVVLKNMIDGSQEVIKKEFVRNINLL